VNNDPIMNMFSYKAMYKTFRGCEKAHQLNWTTKCALHTYMRTNNKILSYNIAFFTLKH